MQAYIGCASVLSSIFPDTWFIAMVICTRRALKPNIHTFLGDLCDGNIEFFGHCTKGCKDDEASDETGEYIHDADNEGVAGIMKHAL